MKFSRRFLDFHAKHRCDLYYDQPEWMRIVIKQYYFDGYNIHM